MIALLCVGMILIFLLMRCVFIVTDIVGIIDSFFISKVSILDVKELLYDVIFASIYYMIFSYVML